VGTEACTACSHDPRCTWRYSSVQTPVYFREHGLFTHGTCIRIFTIRGSQDSTKRGAQNIKKKFIITTIKKYATVNIPLHHTNLLKMQLFLSSLIFKGFSLKITHYFVYVLKCWWQPNKICFVLAVNSGFVVQIIQNIEKILKIKP